MMQTEKWFQRDDVGSSSKLQQVREHGANVRELTTACKLISKQKLIYSKLLCFKVKQTRALLFKV